MKLVEKSFVNDKSLAKDEISIDRDLRFEKYNDLLYYIVDEERQRLCISEFIKQKMFQIAYDQSYHDEFHKIYDRLRYTIYIKHLNKRLRIYIAHCSQCQLNQTKRYFIYDELNSIVISSILFYIIALN